MPEVALKYGTKVNPLASTPNKSHKKLVKIGKNKYLEINGGIRVVKYHPREPIYRKSLPRRKGRKSSPGHQKKPVGKRNMSAAAKKAWATRKARGH
jgi:hypothetical protein